MEEIIINSAKQAPQTVPSSANFTNVYSQTFHNITKVQLNWVSIPDSVYNITSSNDTVLWNQDSPVSANCSSVLTHGLYTSSELATAIQDALTEGGSGSTWTVEFDTATMKYTTQKTDGGLFYWRMAAGPTPYYEFGLSNTVIDVITGRTSTIAVFNISDYISRLERPSVINLSINEFDSPLYLGRGDNSSAPSIASSFLVPFKDGNGAINVYKPFCSKNTKALSTPTTFSSLKVKLTDINGAPVDLNNADWSAHLSIFADVNSGCGCGTGSASSCGCGSSKKQKTCH